MVGAVLLRCCVTLAVLTSILDYDLCKVGACCVVQKQEPLSTRQSPLSTRHHLLPEQRRLLHGMPTLWASQLRKIQLPEEKRMLAYLALALNGVEKLHRVELVACAYCLQSTCRHHCPQAPHLHSMPASDIHSMPVSAMLCWFITSMSRHHIFAFEWVVRWIGVWFSGSDRTSCYTHDHIVTWCLRSRLDVKT